MSSGPYDAYSGRSMYLTEAKIKLRKRLGAKIDQIINNLGWDKDSLGISYSWPDIEIYIDNWNHSKEIFGYKDRIEVKENGVLIYQEKIELCTT